MGENMTYYKARLRMSIWLVATKNIFITDLNSAFCPWD